MQAEGRYATFLVEPTADLAVGVYPIRVVTSEGISNIQLFTVGTFPELTEDESRPGALSQHQRQHGGRAAAAAAALHAERHAARTRARHVPPERQGRRKASDRSGSAAVGSAIDPLLEILDANGKMIAGSEDAPLLGLDARVEVTFPRAGDYYVVVRDSRYSTQTANFYRLKVGSYSVSARSVSIGRKARRAGRDVARSRKRSKWICATPRSNVRQVFVNMPGSPALPVPFAVGDDPEVNAPVE